MTSRTCYLHIGAPKAGSTTIQGFMVEFRDALMARGVDVPLFTENDLVRGGKALSLALRKERDAEAPSTSSWRWLDRRLARTDGDLCISRESLCVHLAAPNAYAFLREFFARRGVRLKILAYVRDSVGFTNASFTQRAKKLSLTDGFDDWIETILAEPPTKHSNMRAFRNIIADDSVAFVVRPLQALGPAGLIGDFLAQIGVSDLDHSGFDETPYRNETPGARTISVSLDAGRMLVERGLAARSSPEVGRDFRALARKRGWSERPFFGPDTALARRITERFAEQNEAFARAVWGTSWADAVPATRKDRNVYDPAAVSPAERAENADLVREFASTLEPEPFWRRVFGWRPNSGAVTARAPSAPPG